ncbi:MAG: hypothetical protein ABI378_01130 [Chitinophagaceae bacterium]
MSTLRFIERFLIMLALIALGIKYSGAKDGATLILIAFPLLQAYYLLASPIFFWKRNEAGKLEMLTLIVGIFCGMGICYSLISLMMHTLNWLPRRDMLENCTLILVMLAIVLFWLFRRKKLAVFGGYLGRGLVLLGMVWVVGVVA